MDQVRHLFDGDRLGNLASPSEGNLHIPYCADCFKLFGDNSVNLFSTHTDRGSEFSDNQGSLRFSQKSLRLAHHDGERSSIVVGHGRHYLPEK